MGNRAQSGFTLVELIVTLGVTAILLGVGVPSFIEVVKDGRISSQATCLNLALFSARSESVKRSADVTVCARASDAQCGTDWKNGALVFVDNSPTTDASAAATIDGGDQVLRSCPPLSDDNLIQVLGSSDGTAAGSGERSHIRYQRTGRTNWSNGYFAICDDRDASKWKAINVAATGDVRTARKHADGDALIDAFNNKLQSCD